MASAFTSANTTSQWEYSTIMEETRSGMKFIKDFDAAHMADIRAPADRTVYASLSVDEEVEVTGHVHNVPSTAGFPEQYGLSRFANSYDNNLGRLTEPVFAFTQPELFIEGYKPAQSMLDFFHNSAPLILIETSDINTRRCRRRLPIGRPGQPAPDEYIAAYNQISCPPYGAQDNQLPHAYKKLVRRLMYSAEMTMPPGPSTTKLDFHNTFMAMNKLLRNLKSLEEATLLLAFRIYRPLEDGEGTWPIFFAGLIEAWQDSPLRSFKALKQVKIKVWDALHKEESKMWVFERKNEGSSAWVVKERVDARRMRVTEEDVRDVERVQEDIDEIRRFLDTLDSQP